jgi:ATP-dependent Clp protease adaptor protein ClpS
MAFPVGEDGWITKSQNAGIYAFLSQEPYNIMIHVQGGYCQGRLAMGISANFILKQIYARGFVLPDRSLAVAEPEQTTVVDKRPDQDRRPKRQPRYHVILWNDDDHTYEYVIRMMKELFGHPIEKGFEIAKTVDKTGRAVCLTTTKEHAELKRDQIHAYGQDPMIAKCKGSMSASIEPEPS